MGKPPAELRGELFLGIVIVTAEQIELAKALGQCTFPPATPQKRFARDMLAIAENNPDRPITDKQDRYLRDLIAKYRRQIPINKIVVNSNNDLTLEVLGRLAPELVKAGLLKNEAWVQSHCAEAVRMFSEEKLHIAATLIAAIHPYAIDYLRQAPILALAITGGPSRRVDSVQIQKASVRLAHAKKLRALFDGGVKTRDLLKAYKIAPPLRAISGGAFRSWHHNLIGGLGRLPPSTLAQAIPVDPELQFEWLERIYRWVQHLSYRFGDLVFFEWAVSAIRPVHGERGLNVTTVADFAYANAAKFNTAWTWEGAARRAQEWHKVLARQSRDEQLRNRYGIGWFDHVDYGDLPVELRLGPFEFKALRSGEELRAEGEAMHNCVADYVDAVIVGRSRIYSVLMNGDRVATLEIIKGRSRPFIRELPSLSEPEPDRMTPVKVEMKTEWRINQIEAPCAERPPQNVVAAAQHFVDIVSGNRVRHAHVAEYVDLSQRVDLPVHMNDLRCVNG